jgi:hypothetical protein
VIKISKVPNVDKEPDWYLDALTIIESATEKQELKSVSKLLGRLQHRIDERRRFL